MLLLDQPDLKKIEHQAQQMPGVISFAQGALKIGGVSPLIKNEIQELLKTDRADYYCHSLGIYALRQAIAQYLSSVHQVKLEPEYIMITHGAINGIVALCLMLLEQGDEVLIPEPTYPPYKSATLLAKGIPKFVPAYQFIHNRWQFDFESIKLSLTSRTKMIILAQPSNPCGIYLNQHELSELIAWCDKQGIYCLIDEAYDNYFFDEDAISCTPSVLHSPFVIRIGSFSKTFGMSGWRVGYVVAQPQLINRMAGIQDGLLVCPNVIGQYAALTALKNEQISKVYTSYIKENRTIAYELLQPLCDEGLFSCAPAKAGFFLFLKTPVADTVRLAEKLLMMASVALVPGKDFGPSGKSFVRLCYARERSLVIEGITRLCEIKNKKTLFD